MARKLIDIGAVGNDGTGDSIRDSFRKVNDNFRELYSSLGLGEKLTFIGLSDTPDNYGVNITTPLVTVNNEGDGMMFKQLVPGNGITLDFLTNPNEITINSDFSDISADDSPQLGGDLSLRSGGNQYRILDAGTTATPLDPVFKHELVNKNYADGKISKAGTDGIDPETGRVNSAFGRMTGPLILSRDPISEDDEQFNGFIAATKRYVDNSAFGSSVNLYVALSGKDDTPGVSKKLQGRALAYAYRTLEAALKRAEELVLEAPLDIGPYRKTLTYNGGAEQCALTAISPSPNSGSGFSGSLSMSVDTVMLNPESPGANYYAGDIIQLEGGTIAEGGGRAAIEVLSTATTPGQIITFKIISAGLYSTLPGSADVGVTVIDSAAPDGIGIGVNAKFNVTYRVNAVKIINGGSGYSLASVRVEGGGGSGSFGNTIITNGAVSSITITNRGTGFTSLPTLKVDLPRFAIFTNGVRTDFTGDVETNTSDAVRGRDIREGLFLKGNTSGALAQILSHRGELDEDGNELFDVDIKFGNFLTGEPISYGDVTRSIQISVLVESGEYYENYPLKISQNVSIVGDEFRRVIIRPTPGTSSSPWAFQKFRRDLTIDGLNTANKLHGYHYLADSGAPVYTRINNKGQYKSAAALLDLNREFVQEEIIAWMNYNITNSVSPFSLGFNYNQVLCKRDAGLIVDAIVFDLTYGDYNRVVSAGLKYYKSQSALIAITTQLPQYLAVIDHLNELMQSIIGNIVYSNTQQEFVSQIVDLAFQSEAGSSDVITDLILVLKCIIDESNPNYSQLNKPKNNDEMDVFLANDGVRWQALTAQGHGGFMGVLDPTGQILAKSPYFQECASFSKSNDQQKFAGGMFVDGFSGNLQFKHLTTTSGGLRLTVNNLERFPQLPASFLVDDTVFRVNYVRDFIYDPNGSSATLILDETSPFTRSPGAQACTISVGAPAIITRSDHRLQSGSTIIFTSDGGDLPAGIIENKEYYVTEDGLSNNTFTITDTYGSIVKISTTTTGSGVISYQRIYELLMPGNRSLLCNDFTQINDLGYGIIAANGGLVESVSMFTYYCHISYYSLTGGQIRSVGGSSAHGNYALVAEGFDPLEIPTPTTLFEDLAQRVKCYFPDPSYQNMLGGLFIYIYAFDYIPSSGSELEIDHNGNISRYPVTSVSQEDSFPSGVVRLNLSVGIGPGETDGLFAIVPADTVMTLRANSQIVLTGKLASVAVRPSTGLKFRETENKVYRVLEFVSVEDSNGPYKVLISNSSPSVIKILVTITDIENNICTTSQNHKLKLGDKFISTVTANGFVADSTYYIVEVPEYNQFKISTIVNGPEFILSSGNQLEIEGIKTHKLQENYTVSFNSTDTLPVGITADQEYYVLTDGLTDTEFTLSPTKNGIAVETTTAGTGEFFLSHTGLTKTNLRENYDYIEYTLWQPGEIATYDVVASNTDATTNLISLSDISYQIKPGMPIVFTGTTFGNIVENTEYFIKTSPYSSKIPIFTIERTGSIATIVTDVRHGLATGQLVNINNTNTELDGDNTAVITVIDLNTFTYTSNTSGLIQEVLSNNGYIIADDKISISATRGGNVFSLTSGAGTLSAVVGGLLPALISINSNSVITSTSHGFEAGDVFTVVTTGTLPEGISKSLNYHVLATDLSTDTFKFSASPGGFPIGTTGLQSGTHSISRTKGREGDSDWAVTRIAAESRSRIVGSKFMWIGEEYIITRYDSEDVTNKPYGKIYVNRPLKNSLIKYSSSYTILGSVPVRSNGANGNLTIRISLTRVTSHDLLEIGTGSYADTNYPKEIYGASVNAVNETTEVEERDVGRVFYVTTDQFGNFKVGPFFKVDQGTGTVTFSSSIALSNLDGIGFKRGVPISEFSTDSAMSDNATDTVPTENAVRIYIERKLGISHDGLSKVRDDLLIPGTTGGFMPLSPPSGVTMKSTMDLGTNKIVNLADATALTDAVNLQSLNWNNFQDYTSTNVSASDMLVFTGNGNQSVNATAIGDVSFNLIASSNQLDIQLVPDTIINSDVKSDAAIAQSKLAMNSSTVRNTETGIMQADLGLASFNSSEFNVTNGWVSIKPNGIVLSDISQISSKTVLGNSTLTAGNVTNVAFSTVVSDGGGIKKSQYNSVGFLRRIAGSSFSSDSDYTIINSSSGSSEPGLTGANQIIVRDSNGDFGGRNLDISQLKIDTNITLDSERTATGGYTRLYAFNTQGGILLSDGSLASDKKTSYWNDRHEFKTQNGISDAPITASSIQVTAITTGGNTTSGTITGRWTLSGTSPNESRLQATYSADLAENYEGDKIYEVGTVLVFGGDKEVTATNIKNDTRVAGVVSNTAAYTMYEACPGHKNLVALQGRVPCKVVGNIEKGDILVTSGIPGVATRAGDNVKVGTVVGKALSAYNSDHIGLLEIAVGRT
jgi:hypothetical protein